MVRSALGRRIKMKFRIVKRGQYYYPQTRDFWVGPWSDLDPFFDTIAFKSFEEALKYMNGTEEKVVYEP